MKLILLSAITRDVYNLYVAFLVYASYAYCATFALPKSGSSPHLACCAPQGALV